MPSHSTSRKVLRVPFLGRLAPPFGRDYVAVEAAGAITIGVAVLIALALANSPWSHVYGSVWNHDVTVGVQSLAVTHSLKHWVNEGLMAIFFFVVGLELKRELVRGELRDRRAAALPVIAALGGIAIPALIFVAMNAGGANLRAWAIPTTTDTAFAVGLLALLGTRAAPNAKVFLLSIAIVDDLGAILMIAIVYSNAVNVAWILVAVVVVCAILGMRSRRVRYWWAYLPPAVMLWIAIFEAGFHATVAGVILGFLTPANTVHGRPVLDQLERSLHPWASLAIVPIFALANAGMTLNARTLTGTISSLGLGVALGLAVGKLVGVFGFSWLALRIGIACAPRGLTSRDLLGVAALAGVGFSVSLFIAELALDGDSLDQAKIGILVGSIVSAALGSVLLTRRRVSTERYDADSRHLVSL